MLAEGIVMDWGYTLIFVALCIAGAAMFYGHERR
jgi:hypothetical protein